MNIEELKRIIKENFSVIVIILFVTMIVFSINANVTSFPGKISSDIKDTIKTDKILNETSTSNMTDEDKELLANDKELIDNFFPLSYSIILDNLDCISKAAKNKNFTDTERCAKFLKEESNKTISQIDSYNKSTSYIEALKLYKKYLEYYNIAGENLEIGARNQNPDQIKNASIYIQKANYGMASFMSSTGNNSNISITKNDTKTPFAKTN